MPPKEAPKAGADDPNTPLGVDDPKAGPDPAPLLLPPNIANGCDDCGWEGVEPPNPPKGDGLGAVAGNVDLTGFPPKEKGDAPKAEGGGSWLLGMLLVSPPYPVSMLPGDSEPIGGGGGGVATLLARVRDLGSDPNMGADWPKGCGAEDEDVPNLPNGPGVVDAEGAAEETGEKGAEEEEPKEKPELLGASEAEAGLGAGTALVDWPKGVAVRFELPNFGTEVAGNANGAGLESPGAEATTGAGALLPPKENEAAAGFVDGCSDPPKACRFLPRSSPPSELSFAGVAGAVAEEKEPKEFEGFGVLWKDWNEGTLSLGLASSVTEEAGGAEELLPKPVKDFPAKLPKEVEGLASESFSSDFDFETSALAPKAPKVGVVVGGLDPKESPGAVVDALGLAVDGGAVVADPKENPVNDLGPEEGSDDGVVEGAEVEGFMVDPNEKPEEAGAGAVGVSAEDFEAPNRRPEAGVGTSPEGFAEPNVNPGVEEPNEMPEVGGLLRDEVSLSLGTTGADFPKEIGVVDEAPKERVEEG
jgi:hypothetical protein